MKTVAILSSAFILLALSGCTSNESPAPTESAPASETSPQALTPLPDAAAPASNVLSAHYVDAAAALAADDFKKAKASFTELAKESTGEMKTLAQAAADTADIAAMREKFKVLSDLATTMELPPDHAVAFCPMYNNNRGGKWVQKKGTLANPYFGSQMLTCGSFVN